jgi:dynein heavy chain
MVTACKTYIAGDGVTRLWDQPRLPLVEKLQHCLSLYENYQASFQKTKEKIDATPGERPFEFSEMYIFGKFETFCRRLDKV